MKVRVCNPKTGHTQAFNTDHIASWHTSQLVNRIGDPVPGFAIRIFTSDGRETVVHCDQGGEELLQALETEYYPLNDLVGEVPKMETNP